MSNCDAEGDLARSQLKLCGGEELPTSAQIAKRATALIDRIRGADEGNFDGRLSCGCEEVRRRASADLVDKIVKHLGIALRTAIPRLVSCTDPKELERVKESWVAKKLGISDGAKADASIEKTCKAMHATTQEPGDLLLSGGQGSGQARALSETSDNSPLAADQRGFLRFRPACARSDATLRSPSG